MGYVLEKWPSEKESDTKKVVGTFSNLANKKETRQKSSYGREH